MPFDNENAKNIKPSQQGFTINSFNDFSQLIKDHDFFESYEYEIVEDGILSIYKNGLTKIFLCHTQSEAKGFKKDYIAKAKETGIPVVFLADSQTEYDPSPYVHGLSFPMSAGNVFSFIQTVDHFQSIVEENIALAENINTTSNEIKHILSISRTLNGERNTPRLLELILNKAREVTQADAASIYTVEHSGHDIRNGKLVFKTSQNDSIKQNLQTFELPINEQSIVGNAVIHQTSIAIPDLYLLDEDPSKNPYNAKHDRSWDKRLGYESHSMLSLPMFDISHNVVGVIQLINRKKDPKINLKNSADFKDAVMPFSETDIEFAEIIAQQAGIALENANMTDEIQNLFDGFVDAAVTAIEQRDPTTSGHSHRVASLTLSLAEKIDVLADGSFRDIKFNAEQMLEIKYASLLHDFGKLGVRENVLVKAKKLYPWQHDLLLERFNLIRSSIEIEYLRSCNNILKNPSSFPTGVSTETFRIERDTKVKELDEFLNFILKANEPTVLEKGGFELLNDIANYQFNDLSKKGRPYLTAEEMKALSVSRGSLNAEEFAEIQSHVTHTYEFLRKIPWGQKLANVPQIAAKHHEKLDGTGYPLSASANEIPIQSRMMTISDIYDALTAADRPYKKAMPQERALDILAMEVQGGKVDPELFNIFVEADVFKDTDRLF